MPLKGRNQPGIPTGPSTTSSAEALTHDDLTRLELDDLIQLPLAGAAHDPAPRAAQTAASPQGEAPPDFTDMSLEQLLSVSVSGKDQPDEEKQQDEDPGDGGEGDGGDPPPLPADGADHDADHGADHGDGGGQDDGATAAPDGGSGLSLDLLVESIDWLSQEDGLPPLGGDYGVFDQGVATAASAYSLSLGPGLPAPLGNQPVPSAIPGPPSDPIQTLFAPFAINLLDGTIGEAWSVADSVGRVKAAGTAAPVSYLLIDDAGGRFAIDGATGDVTIVSGPFDFTAQSSYTIIVQAADGAKTLQRAFTIQVSPDDGDGAGLPGDQTLSGGAGNSDDLLYGGAGNDTISGLNGNDALHGGSGDDLLMGGNHDDRLFGGSGNDVLRGGNHADSLFGGTGDDTLWGENHDDRLFGGGGADRLHGGDGADWLHGQGGNDWLDGGSGADVLMGGADDDVLLWDSADLVVDGGGGNDTLLVVAGDIDVTSFGGDLANIETVDLTGDPGPTTLSLTAADLLDMTDNGLLTVLGDAGDSVSAGSGWALSQVDASGGHLYVHTVGPDVVGLLLGPDVQFDPQGGG